MGIEEIRLNPKSRDDIPAILLGLQHLYADADLRSRLFALLEQELCPGVSLDLGRPGLELWKIVVMGVVMQGLGCDFDRLQESVNEHRTLRKFLGHATDWAETAYEYQTVVDNVCLLRPELLVVESGHRVAKKKLGEPLRGRCDSFVVETDVHYPTDVSLLWDAMRCLLRTTGRAAGQHGVRGWRQWRHLSREVQARFHRVRTTRRAQAHPERVAAYLQICRTLVARAETTLGEPGGVAPLTGVQIEGYLAHARRQIDQAERLLLRGDKQGEHPCLASSGTGLETGSGCAFFTEAPQAGGGHARAVGGVSTQVRASRRRTLARTISLRMMATIATLVLFPAALRA